MFESALDFLSQKLLREYAGTSSFERGKSYFDSGAVFSLETYEGKIAAKVSGTRDYRVKLWAEDEDELGYDCNCPYADEGNFCKHCVAVGLAWINERKKDINRGGSGEKGPTDLDVIKNHLQTMEKAELVEMLMQEILENETLRGQMLLAAARSNPRGVDVKAYRKEIERVFDIDDCDDYDGYGYSDDIKRVTESIQDLFEDGHAEMVVDLCEYALKIAAQSLNSISNSDSELYSVIEELQELHLEACAEAKPDVEKLARRLFDREINDSWDIFYDAADKYYNVLGKKGLKLYRQLIEAEWKKLPALKPGDKKSYDGARWRVTQMMESLARAEGDIEKLVEIKSRDLSSQYNYYEIAEIYRENKQYSKALEWAERGVQDFPEAKEIDFRLNEFLANEYHRVGRHDKAMQLIWKSFEERHGLSSYNKLKENAGKIKPESTWPFWREKALSLIRQNITKANQKQSGATYLFHQTDNSLLVEIFLSENLSEKAWEEANKGGCNESLWLKLANIREKEYPADALKIYKARISPKIAETNNQAYEQAVSWLKKIEELMRRLGKKSEFDSYVLELRAGYKAKRNFIKLLDLNKW